MRWVDEPIRPLLGAETEARATGEPALPTRFVWRDREYAVAEVIKRWKGLSPGTAAMPDRYLRKHWFRIRTTDGLEMDLYFERKARSAGAAKTRWWLFTVSEEP
jgi:hypothetical protein